jgi:hypothetical protein
MAKLVDYVEELVTEVGPRPMGTQQENDASEIIATRMEGFGLPVQIDEFVCTRNVGWVRALYCALAVIGAEMLFFLSNLHILGLILILLAVVCMVLDLLDKNPLNSLFKNSLSQNVIAKYLPNGAASARSRRIVILANYDSARAQVQAAPLLVQNYPLIRRIVNIVIAALLVLAILIVAPLPDLLDKVLGVLIAIGGIVVLLAFLAEIINFFMPYTQGANCNGSGIAVLYGVAQRLVGGVDKDQAANTSRSARRSRRSREDQSESRSDRVAGVTSTVKTRGENPDDARGRSSEADVLTRPSRDLEQSESAGSFEYSERPAHPQTSPRSSSVADNLVTSPFIAQRPPLAQIEEQRRLEAEERNRELEEQRRQAEQRNPNGVPAWFAKAQEKAEKNKERKEKTDESHEVVRSRFADIPLHIDKGSRSTPSTSAPSVPASAPSAPPSAPSVPAPVAGLAEEGLDPATSAGTSATSTGTNAESAATSENTTPPTLEATDQFNAVQAAQAAAAAAPSSAPVSNPADLSGLDRQAFRVLPSEDGRSSTIIEPSLEAAPSQEIGQTPESAPITDALAAQRSRLRDLPSISGSIPAQQAALDVATVNQEELSFSSPVNATGAFMPLGTTGLMKPVGEELLDYHDEGEIFVADADDSQIGNNQSASSGYGQPEQVSIPSSRVKSFFGSMGDRFAGRKKETLESAPTDWLGVDEDFDARKDGAEIGSWENFNDDDDAGWRGGAFGGQSFGENVEAMMEASTALLDKEVWLVALGAHESQNAGIKSLLATYPTELRNALFINVVGVGSGDLCVTLAEGDDLRTVGTDHRLQGVFSEGGQTLGVQVGQVSFKAFQTDATEILKQGGRSISLIGLKKQMPAGWHWSDDDVSHLTEDNLQDATELVIEAIKGV